MQNTNNNISKIKINVVISTRISFTKLIVERKQFSFYNQINMLHIKLSNKITMLKTDQPKRTEIFVTILSLYFWPIKSFQPFWPFRLSKIISTLSKFYQKVEINFDHPKKSKLFHFNFMYNMDRDKFLK